MPQSACLSILNLQSLLSYFTTTTHTRYRFLPSTTDHSPKPLHDPIPPSCLSFHPPFFTSPSSLPTFVPPIHTPLPPNPTIPSLSQVIKSPITSFLVPSRTPLTNCPYLFPHPRFQSPFVRTRPNHLRPRVIISVSAIHARRHTPSSFVIHSSVFFTVSRLYGIIDHDTWDTRRGRNARRGVIMRGGTYTRILRAEV